MTEASLLHRSFCDQSGLCEEVTAIRSGHPNSRLVALLGTASVLVDVAPVSLGHLLVVGGEHVPRTTLLGGAALADVRQAVDLASRRLTQQFGAPIAEVEHGSGNVRSAGDCVRHCHIHLVPILRDQEHPPLERLLKPVLEDVQAITSTKSLGDNPAGYVCVRVAGQRYVGFPREGVRHVARVILSLLTGADPAYADWGLMIRNPQFDATINLLNGTRLRHVV